LKLLLEIAELRINEYHAVRRLKADPQDKGTNEYLEGVRVEISELQGIGDKTKKAKVEKGRESKTEEDKENVAPQVSDITLQVEEANGKVRTPTGISVTDGAGQVRHRR
jgi:hypothetical protein